MTMAQKQIKAMQKHMDESTVLWNKTIEICGHKWDKSKDGGYHKYKEVDEHYNYVVKYGKTAIHDELRWCAVNCEGRFYRCIPDEFNTTDEYVGLIFMQFENEIDAIAFKLRWL